MFRATLAAALCGALLAAVFMAAPVPARAQGNPDWDSGVSHYNQKQYRSAIADFSNVREANPEFANTYYFLGMSHYLIKEYAKAIGHLNRYLQLKEKEGKPPKSDARVALGDIYFTTGDYASAETTFAVLTQTVPDEPLNFYSLGVTYQKLNKTDKAIDALSAGLKLNPKPATKAGMLDLLTRLLLSKAFASKAPADFQAAVARGEQLRLARDDAESASLLGSAYLGVGDFAKAAVHYARVVADKPEDGAGWFRYGFALSRSSQFPQAEKALTKASTLTPNDVSVWAEMAYVLESLKKYPKAREAYEKAYQINPDPSFKEAADRLKDY